MALANSTITMHLSLCNQDQLAAPNPGFSPPAANRHKVSLHLNKSGGLGRSWNWVWEVQGRHRVSGNSPIPMRRTAV